MSRTIFRIDTYRKQLEITNLISKLDTDFCSVQSRREAISSKAASVQLPNPVPLLHLQDNFHPVVRMTREFDLNPVKGVVQDSPSKASQELEQHVQGIAVQPVQLHAEKTLTSCEKHILAEVRSVTHDKVSQLLKCLPIEGVQLKDCKLIRQDGNVYDLESVVQDDHLSAQIRVRSKVTLLSDGSIIVHQLGDHSRKNCEQVGKNIAGTIDLALNKVYLKEFMFQEHQRKVVGSAYVAGEKIVLGEELCG